MPSSATSTAQAASTSPATMKAFMRPETYTARKTDAAPAAGTGRRETAEGGEVTDEQQEEETRGERAGAQESEARAERGVRGDDDGADAGEDKDRTT